MGRKLQEINVQTSNEPVEERPTTSIVESSTSIWKQFDEQISSVLGQNNPSGASIIACRVGQILKSKSIKSSTGSFEVVVWKKVFIPQTIWNS